VLSIENFFKPQECNLKLCKLPLNIKTNSPQNATLNIVNCRWISTLTHPECNFKLCKLPLNIKTNSPQNATLNIVNCRWISTPTHEVQYSKLTKKFLCLISPELAHVKDLLERSQLQTLQTAVEYQSVPNTPAPCAATLPPSAAPAVEAPGTNIHMNTHVCIYCFTYMHPEHVSSVF